MTKLPTVKNFDASKVMKAYSGKPGCMCGCKGKWSYRPEAKGPGYEVDRSDRAVNTVARNMQRFVVENNTAMKLDVDAKCVYVETDRKVYAVYFD